MKLSIQILFVTVLIVGLCLSTSAFAAASFTNEENDQDMGNPANWDDTLEAGNNAQVEYDKYTGEIEPAILGPGDYVISQKFRVGFHPTGTTMIVDGGTIESGRGDKARDFFVAENDFFDTGHIEMYSGLIDHDQRNIWIGGEGHGTMFMSGGTVDSAVHFALAQDGTGSKGEMTMEGGTIITGSDLKVGRRGTGTWDMTGGYLDIGRQLIIAEDAGSSGQMDLHGGLAEALVGDAENPVDNLIFGEGTGNLDIAYDGKLILGGDEISRINGFVTDGLITSLGTNQVTAMLNGDGNTEVTGIPEPATVAMLSLGGLVLLRRKRS